MLRFRSPVLQIGILSGASRCLFFGWGGEESLSSITCAKRGLRFLSLSLSLFLSFSLSFSSFFCFFRRDQPLQQPLPPPRVLSSTAVIKTYDQGPKAETSPVGCCDAPNAVSNFLIAPSPQKFSNKRFAIPSVWSRVPQCQPTAKLAAAPPAKKNQSSSPSNSSTSTTGPKARKCHRASVRVVRTACTEHESFLSSVSSLNSVVRLPFPASHQTVL